jgi:hypothetical protein
MEGGKRSVQNRRGRLGGKGHKIMLSRKRDPLPPSLGVLRVTGSVGGEKREWGEERRGQDEYSPCPIENYCCKREEEQSFPLAQRH